jgi:hypothetical protein
MVRCLRPRSIETVRQVACVSDDDGWSVSSRDACPSSVGGPKGRSYIYSTFVGGDWRVGGVTARQEHTAIGIN